MVNYWNQKLWHLAAMVAVCLCGCGGNSNLAGVEGTVTMDGKPLSDATVLFVNSSTRPSAAKTDEKGFYRLRFSDRESGAVIGKNIVRISTAQGIGLREDGSSIPGVKESVPMKYNVKSTLEFNVEPNKTNVANWELDSKGPVLKGD